MAFIDDICAEIQGLEPGTYYFEIPDQDDLPQEPLTSCPGSVLYFVGQLPKTTAPPESIPLFYRIVIQVYFVGFDLTYQATAEVRSANDTEWFGISQSAAVCFTVQPCAPEPTDDEDCLCCNCDCGCS